MIRVVIFILSFTLLPCFGSITWADDYLVTFQTTDCNGDVGFGSVEINKIYKIETMKCDPPHGEEVRKHVLVSSRTDITEYDVFTVSVEEAERISIEMKEYMRIRRDLLERSDGVIIKH
ncbi:MAG: hypothetical protein OEM02_03950 [Desulfobulbaceae bacterium]|nr:hypothetical protein [Desulfobulbaceae bacterium]